MLPGPVAGADDGHSAHYSALVDFGGGQGRACVGCCPGPSPALMMGTDATDAAILALPAWKWRSTMQSA